MKEEKKKKSPGKIQKRLALTCLVLDVLAVIVLFIVYGPLPQFRNFWITSAMGTMSHQYLAYIFYDNQTIIETMSHHSIIESEEDTDASDIIFDQSEIKDVYDSIYDEQVLKREPNQEYKVIEVSGSGYKGHLIAIYDASKVSLAQSSLIASGGQQLPDLAKENNAKIAINASGFSLVGNAIKPTGNVIMNGKLVSYGGGTGYGGGIIGFNQDNVLVLTQKSATEAIQSGIRDAVDFGPFLIVNGKPAEMKGNGGFGVAPRTAIAQRKDGIVLFLVIDGRRPGHSIGIDMVEMTKLLLKYKAYNAANLDGGGSSTLVVNQEVLSVAGGYGYQGDRYLPNAWIVK